MTDNEIIKGFSVCNHFEKGFCGTCPYDRGRYDNSCLKDLRRDVYNLINRQNAEIERLEHAIQSFKNIGELYREVREEAVKEFAERFENEFDKIEQFYFEEEHEIFVSANKVFAFLDNIKKEMVGEG